MQSISALIDIRAIFEVAVSQRHQIQVPIIDLQIVKKVRVAQIHKIENIMNVFIWPLLSQKYC